MKHLIRIITAVMLMIVQQNIFARPYYGETFSLKQPDDSQVSVKIFGNEFYQDVESMDGYTLIRDEKTNEICYAMLSKDGEEYASTGIVYTNSETPDAVKSIIKKGIRISKESVREKQEETKAKLNFGKQPEINLRAARVLPDTVYGIVVLVDFPDTKSQITRQQVEEFCNGDNYKEFGNFQSIKEYFQWISNGKLTYLNYVTDFYTAPNNKSYYDSGDDYKDDLFMPIIEEAINKEEYVKISDLTSIEGRLLAINIFYAGTADAGWAHGLWPHMGWFQFKIKGYQWNIWHTFQMSDLGSKLTIGTFIHENGHLVCDWPDFYSYDEHEDNNNIYGIGEGDGNYNPGVPSPWCLDQLGWLDKIDITNINDGRKITLEHKVGQAATYYGSKNGAAPDEKYYIEVRKSTSEHYENFEGIFIWHNNEKGDNTTEGEPEQQDCRPASYNDPCFKQGNKTEFNDDTNPSGVWYNGTRSGIDLWDFSAKGSTMSFRCGKIIENPEIKNDVLDNAISNIEYKDTIEAVGGSYNYIFELIDGSLPEGLELKEDGSISGIATETGSFSFTIKVTDSESKSSTKEITLNVVNSTPYNDYIAIPGTLEFENYDNGGEGIAYHDTEEGNEGNSIRVEENVDIYTSDAGGYGIGWTANGEWLQYSIDVKESGFYNASLFHASYDEGIVANFYLDGEILIPDFVFPASGSWGTDSKKIKESKIEEIKLTMGIHKLRVVLNPCSGIDLDKMTFTKVEASSITETKVNALQLFNNNNGFTLNSPYKETTVTVYNADGSILKTFKTNESTTFFGSNYPKNLYFIQVVTNGECKVFKMIK